MFSGLGRTVLSHVLRGYNGNRRMHSGLFEEKSPLMIDEVLGQLNLSGGHTVLDMTFGAGLHSTAILETIQKVSIIALDRDPCAFKIAQNLAEHYPGQVKPLLGRFSDLPKLLDSLGIRANSLDAIVIDLGCSSMQLNEAGRGFSPLVDGPLDMRMDGSESSESITALDILQVAEEHDLSRIFRIYGNEEQHKKIAKSIISCRYTLHSLDTTFKLKNFLRAMCDVKPNRVIKNVFYALRTFVNNEANELNYALYLSHQYLKKGGRLVSLTFNQLEDTIIKRHLSGNVLENSPNVMPLQYYSQTYNLNPDEINELRKSPWSSLTKHVLTANKQETPSSYRLQSAKLRSAVKL